MPSEAAQDIVRAITHESIRCTVSVGEKITSVKTFKDLQLAIKERRLKADSIRISLTYGEGIAVDLTPQETSFATIQQDGENEEAIKLRDVAIVVRYGIESAALRLSDSTNLTSVHYLPRMIVALVESNATGLLPVPVR